MSRWTDPGILAARDRGAWGPRPLGAVVRELKRLEAEERNARTPEERRRRNRKPATEGRS